MASALEAFTDAINTYDAEALLAATTEDSAWTSAGAVRSRAEFVAYFEANYDAGDFRFESTGEPIVGSDGDAYVAESRDG